MSSGSLLTQMRNGLSLHERPISQRTTLFLHAGFGYAKYEITSVQFRSSGTLIMVTHVTENVKHFPEIDGVV